MRKPKMAPSPGCHGYSLFCDDIRAEMGNKRSIIGVYQGAMYVNTDFPATLPKFCILVNYIEPFELPFKPLKLLCFFPGNDGDVPNIALDVPVSAEAIENVPDGVADEDRIRHLQAPLTFAPFGIEAPGRIRIRIQRGEDEIIKCGALLISSSAPEGVSEDGRHL